MYDDYAANLGKFWTPLLAFVELLGIYLVILGLAVAGLVSAMRSRDREREKP